MTADRTDWPLPQAEITRVKQIFRELCPHFSLSSSLSTSTFLPLSFNWGLVVSSLKACPHIPTSSLRALDHLLPTCRPTGTDRKQIEIHPAALKHTLLLDVQSDCICRISLTSGRIKTIHFHAQSNLFCIFPNSLEIMTYYHITDPLLSTHSSPNTAPSHSLRGMAENREYKLSYQGERVRRNKVGERKDVMFVFWKKWPLNSIWDGQRKADRASLFFVTHPAPLKETGMGETSNAASFGLFLCLLAIQKWQNESSCYCEWQIAVTHPAELERGIECSRLQFSKSAGSHTKRAFLHKVYLQSVFE